MIEQSTLVPLWKALADQKRRRIIQMLGEKARTTGELCAHFDVSRFAVMRHLKVLEQAGFVRSEREGRLRWNFLNESLLEELRLTYLDNGTSSENQLTELLGALARQEGVVDRRVGAPEGAPIQMEVTLQAVCGRIFSALTEEIDAWWGYRIASDSRVFFEAQVGGRFYEAFAGGGGALYALVTYLKPNEEIRLSGSMGVAEDATSNLIQIRLREAAQGSTELQLRHLFLGAINPVMIETFRSSWEELLTHQLRSFVEDASAQKEQNIG